MRCYALLIAGVLLWSAPLVAAGECGSVLSAYPFEVTAVGWRTAIDLEWAAAPGAKVYEVYMAFVDEPVRGGVLLVTTPETHFRYVTSSPARHYFQVRAVTTGCAVSDTGTVVAQISHAAPLPPVIDLQVTKVPSSIVRLTWPVVLGASWYEIRRGDIGIWSDSVVLGFTAGTNWSDPTLNDGRGYYYLVTPL